MQTNLSDKYRDTALGKEADSILRSCVHCGFCTATCPTYQLLGDELDGPRGRIYLIKQMLEGNEVTQETRRHLDRCLTCRACETTCPSGVRYGRLVDIGREIIEQQVGRSITASLQRWLLRRVIPYAKRFGLLLALGRIMRPVFPHNIRQKIPVAQTALNTPQQRHSRRMLVLAGCAQSAATPRTNQAAKRVLDRLGITLFEASEAGCCGSMSQHMAQPDEARRFMKRNIDAWWPHIDQGVEAIVITASGCGTIVKDYAELLQHDTDYSAKARRVSELARDLSEVIQREPLETLLLDARHVRVAFHSPCTLQHGQQLNGVVEDILHRVGFQLVPVQDSHLCCGSAGTYSILQPVIAQQLLNNKLAALQQHEADVIATANIGCQLHLATRAEKPVKHWIELVDDVSQHKVLSSQTS